MIYYFSGTGNSEYAAKKIAKETGDKAENIADFLNRGFAPQSEEVTGIVFPVYFWGLPEIVERFALKIKNSLGKYVYCVITCGADTGAAAQILEKKLERKLDYAVSLRMPDNYVMMYEPCGAEKSKKFLAHSDKELEEICRNINSKKIGGERSFEKTVKSAVLSKFYNLFRVTSKFYADEKCTSCGMCEKLCPDAAIKIKNGRPVWTKPKCQHCTACINRCPQKAVQFGKKTAARGRYNIYDIQNNKSEDLQ